MAETEKLLEEHLRAGKEYGLKAVWGGGLWRSSRGRDPAMERESLPPCHIPLKSKCRGTSPGRSGPAPEQTGSHRTGPQASSPRLAPSHPILPRLAQAYGSQASYPQWSCWSPTRQRPISEPSQALKQQQHPQGEKPCREASPLPSG